MLNRIIQKYRAHKKKKEWRIRNAHNRSYMVNDFKLAFVNVGRETYGGIEVINYSEHFMLSVGNFCSIGPGVLFIVCGDHSTNQISTFPFKVRLGQKKYEALSKGDITVGDDVWIGARAIILSGVKIGQGALICAGAVVTKDVPPYAIVAGVPAKILRMRCSEKRIQELLSIDYAKLESADIRMHMDDLYADIELANIDWMPKREKK